MIKDCSVCTKPFFKWAGGKRQLLAEIGKYYPFCDEVITKYAEPFVGGGAVLFDILNKYNLEEIYILEKEKGFTKIYKASDNPLAVTLVKEGDLPGALWKQGLLNNPEGGKA